MHYFSYKRNNLYCEDVEVKDLAKKFGTPLYVYSARTILGHFYKIKKAFSKIRPLVCYSVKANSNLSLLRLLVNKGAGLDIVSGGELYRAKKVKCPPKRVVYASVGKTDKEIKDAIDYGIFMFNVESSPELKRINHIAGRLNKEVSVALRINPDIDSCTHAYIATARKETKFGMDINTVKNILLGRSDLLNLRVIGIHLHIGSQITQGFPFVRAIKKVKTLLKELEKKGIHLEYLNIGGGLGIVYDKEEPQTAKEFAKKVLPLLKEIKLKVVLEPGRFIMGNSGVLLTRVTYVKRGYNKKFVIVDAAMNDLMRPALYDAYHRIISLVKNPKSEVRNPKLADIVGPVCESGDFLGKNRKLAAEEGDYLAILGAGAYGFSMSSNYNSRPRAAEVLVKGSKYYLIRERETYKDLTDKEIVI